MIFTSFVFGKVPPSIIISRLEVCWSYVFCNRSNCQPKSRPRDRSIGRPNSEKYQKRAFMTIPPSSLSDVVVHGSLGWWESRSHQHTIWVDFTTSCAWLIIPNIRKQSIQYRGGVSRYQNCLPKLHGCHALSFRTPFVWTASICPIQLQQQHKTLDRCGLAL